MIDAKESTRNKVGMPKKFHAVSHNFKLAVMALLFALILSRLTLQVFYPGYEILPDEALLFVLLFIASYLWMQELRDYYHLLHMYRDLQAAHEQLKQSEIDTIASLIKVEEEKDVDTKGHSERVAKIAVAIAEEMGLDEETKSVIFRAGILHDIGKVGVDDTILHKVDVLTTSDWEAIKSHPQRAVEILEPLKFLAMERSLILSHHERYDGKGYPEGRRGEEIRIEARILAVADAFDAMNSCRAYRNNLPKEKIVSELEKARDTQLSAVIVDIFLGLLKRRPDLWEK